MNLIEADLRLLQTAAAFDLSKPEGRQASVEALRNFYKLLHARLQPAVTLEIGAREASFSCEVRQVLPDARIFAFEANPHCVRRFGMQPQVIESRVDYRHAAVADHEGTREFFIQLRRGDKPKGLTAGSNSILERSGDVETEAVTVPCIRVDRFLEREQLSGPMTAWIDVEGALGPVLAGFGDAIGQFQMLFMEVEEREVWVGQAVWRDVLATMVERGFYPIARDFEFPDQFNVLFVRTELLQDPILRQALAEHFAARPG